jgi:glucosamine-6-phosphate deaminase
VKIIICRDAATAAASAADSVAQAVRSRPGLVLGLATGRTMEPFYDCLVTWHRDQALDFSGCHTFNVDEYAGLPADDRHSFSHYMNEHLFSKVNLRPENTHLPDGMADDPAAECERYERLIAQSHGIDLQVLGIGLNGHIGFNEPPSQRRSRTHVQLLSPATRAQNAPLFSKPDEVPRSAITMGVGTILDSRRCLVLVTGAAKADIVARALAGPISDSVPASALQLHAHCTVILDQAAASRIEKPADVAAHSSGKPD